MITNGSFETAGTARGEAQGWQSNYIASAELIADFAQNAGQPSSSQEGFEAGWTTDPQELIAVFQGYTIDLDAPVFNTGDAQTPMENFERGWTAPAATLLPTLTSIEAAVFASSGAVETFGTAGVTWSVPEDLSPSPAGTFDYTMGLTEAAAMGTETFATGWGAFDLTLGSATAATFDTNEAVEDFEETQAPEPCTVSSVTDRVAFTTLPAVTIANGHGIRFSTDGELPTPLNVDTTYYVVGSVVWSAFEIAAHVNGNPLDFTDEGTGSLLLHRDPAKWWSSFMTTV